ncbi:retrovirus-related Pol polyprotein from transposon 17.6 [Trichonephila clavipes]|uniref:Retrovirus-related Pol polyprotein from transposon 17.6 n=1 Tax=Trichonephila clavipes TaxID=2585209 RepID=A0A8X6VNV7_TRICX|nr:retrovirus-related Pol polyprotein from transposon 17.6 [Trichonephila clavipes]
MMSEILSGSEKYATPYLADIEIFSETWEEHLKHLQEISERLKKANLTIKPSKCKFAQREVQYLGHVVGRVAPLTYLLKGVNKKGGIVWNDKCSDSFKMLKEKLSEKPVLHATDFSTPFILQTDASYQGYGVVLAQKYEYGGEHPILFLSHPGPWCDLWKPGTSDKSTGSSQEKINQVSPQSSLHPLVGRLVIRITPLLKYPWKRGLWSHLVNTRCQDPIRGGDRLCGALVLHFFLAQRCSADVMLQRHVIQVDMLEQLFSFYLRKTSYYHVVLQPPL